MSVLNPLERNELEKAIVGRGVSYATMQLIMRDFDTRIRHLEKLYSDRKIDDVTQTQEK